MYDWADSAFATTVMAGFFPIFFKQYWSVGDDVNLTTARLGFANSLASLLVALMSPILGAIADRRSAKKRFLLAFGYLGALMTAALFGVAKGEWMWAVFFYAMGSIGFASSNVFYDALLVTVAPPEKVDAASGVGYGLGYLGGGLLFLVNVAMVQFPTLFGLSDAGEAVRWSFLTVALWWGGFAMVTWRWVEEPRSAEHGRWLAAIRAGLRETVVTLRRVRKLRTLSLFLAAYWLYIDGVDTIIKMAVDYGLSLGFQDSDLILALLMVQFIGFPSAILYSKLGERWGVRRAIFLAIAIYGGVTIWGMMMTSRLEFFGLAAAIGLVQGGIQALSRSYYSRLIPAQMAGQFYGFYNMLGKFAAILGPALMAVVGLLVKRALLPAVATPEEVIAASHLAARWSIGSVLILFALGATLLRFVDERKGSAEAAALGEKVSVCGSPPLA